MSLVIWNPAWETGIALIDQQHRDLLAQFEALLGAIHDQRSEARVPEWLAFLADHVETHFSTEKVHIMATESPAFPEHKAIHEQMPAQVAGLLAGGDKTPKNMTEEVVNFLTGWLLRHINEAGRQMARHLRMALHQDSRANP